MCRFFTICTLFVFASYCNGDDTTRPYANPTGSDAAKEARPEPSPNAQQPPKLDEATRKRIEEQVIEMIDKYEARISQLEDELASRSNSNPQPSYVNPTLVTTPTPVLTPDPVILLDFFKRNRKLVLQL